MPEPVYRMLTLLCALVAGVPVGTNLGLLPLLWMLASGQLLAARGARFPSLAACGLSARAVRRAWAALGQGEWASARLLDAWAATVAAEGRWEACRHGGYRPVAVDITGFWRPRLRGCPTTHYHAEAGKALPAIPVGLVARVGRAGGQRLALPAAFVRADPADPAPRAHERRLVREAVARCAPDEVLVLDGGFGLALLEEAGATRYVVRAAKVAVFRRAAPPPYTGTGRRPTRGERVRPLPRTFKGQLLPATPPDRVETWRAGDAVLRAEVWAGLVRADAEAGADGPALTAVAIRDPRHREPLLLVTPLPLTPRQIRDCYRDRWPVEQLPLAAKQVLGAARQFVSAPETCRRLPDLALLAGAVLSYAAATSPAAPSGFWDRRPRPTPGRLRRLLARTPFPHSCPLPGRIREKASATAHLRTGFWGQRRRAADPATLDQAA
jgi:hypothetical protein